MTQKNALPGIPLIQRLTLIYLAHGVPLSELRTRDGYSSPQVCSALTSLQEKGLISYRQFQTVPNWQPYQLTRRGGWLARGMSTRLDESWLKNPEKTSEKSQ